MDPDLNGRNGRGNNGWGLVNPIARGMVAIAIVTATIVRVILVMRLGESMVVLGLVSTLTLTLTLVLMLM